MNLRALREALWWAVDDGTNAADLEVLTSGMDIRLINEALTDLADCLQITKYNNVLTPNPQGVVTLPTDVYEVERVKWGGADLKHVDNVHKIDADPSIQLVSSYMHTGRTTLQLYGTPAPPFSAFDLWYKAYPVLLINDTDEPVEVPTEFRLPLATVYARARFLDKMDTDKRLAQHLLGAWFMFKKQLRGAVDARQRPSAYTGKWMW